MPGFIGLPELLLLGLIVLVLFGPKRLPEMGRGLGKGLREFKDSVSGDHDHHDKVDLTSVETDRAELTPPATVPAPIEDRERVA